MRLVAAIVVLVACGGGPKPAPAPSSSPATPAPAPVATDEVPPPEPPASKPEPAPEQVAINKGGDPCEGGEATGIMASGEGGGGGNGVVVGGIGGHGSGTGTGAGGLRGRTAARPTVMLGEPTVKGDLDVAIVRRYVKRNLNKVQYCYEKQLLAKAGLRGKLVVKFAITDQGLTEQVTTPTSFDGDVAACVVEVFKAIEFPKPKTGRVAVSYPFTFASAP